MFSEVETFKSKSPPLPVTVEPTTEGKPYIFHTPLLVLRDTNNTLKTKTKYDKQNHKYMNVELNRLIELDKIMKNFLF